MKNKKSLGQNWLKDREILDDIAALSVTEHGEKPDLCLEIGPGLGTLTSSLLRVYKEVLAVEFDENLAHNLPNSFPGKNLRVVHADFLQFDLESISSPYVVAANIPYYITSPIIQKLITAKNAPLRIVLLIQKEVAERIAAEDGNQSLLSLTVQNRAFVTLGPVVGKEFFTPVPKVDSQIIILDPKSAPEVPENALSLARIGFSSPRKKLTANLSHGLAISRETASQGLVAAGLSPDCRPANLSLQDWQKLAINLEKFNHKR